MTDRQQDAARRAVDALIATLHKHAYHEAWSFLEPATQKIIKEKWEEIVETVIEEEVEHSHIHHLVHVANEGVYVIKTGWGSTIGWQGRESTSLDTARFDTVARAEAFARALNLPLAVEIERE